MTVSVPSEADESFRVEDNSSPAPEVARLGRVKNLGSYPACRVLVVEDIVEEILDARLESRVTREDGVGNHPVL